MAFKFVVLCSVLAIASAGLLGPVSFAAPAVEVAHKVSYANPDVHAVAATHENVVRSFDGTVSSFSKSVDTPYSSVRKQDTRISNNVYHQAKPVAYTAPALKKTVTYATPSAVTYSQHGPVAASYSHVPVVSKTILEPVPTAALYRHATAVVSRPVQDSLAYHHFAPNAVTHAAQSAASYQQSAPTTYSHAAPTSYTHAAPTSYTHTTPTRYTHAAPAAAYTHAAPTNTKTVSYAAPATTSYSHGPAATTYTHNAPGVSGYGSSQRVHYSPAEMVSHMSFEGFGTHWGY